MKKRFVVALDSYTDIQNNEFKSYIKDNGYGWWHWINGFWLLVDNTGDLTAKKLRDDLAVIYPGVHKLILELRGDDDTWSGFGPKTENKDMFSWLKKNW